MDFSFRNFDLMNSKFKTYRDQQRQQLQQLIGALPTPMQRNKKQKKIVLIGQQRIFIQKLKDFDLFNLVLN